MFCLSGRFLVSACSSDVLTILQALRHDGPKRYGLTMGNDGSVPIASILELANCSEHELRTIVQDDEKTRFIMHDGVIRCSQGHSIKSITDDHLIPVPLWFAERLPCIHGTYIRHLASISRVGLLPGGYKKGKPRLHVHCTPFGPHDKPRGASWIRDDTEVLVQVRMADAIRAGVQFFKSENNALLCRGVPPEFVDDVYWDCAENCYKQLPGRPWSRPMLRLDGGGS